MQCAVLWRWQIMKSPWLSWFSVEWYRHTVLCILPFAWEVKIQTVVNYFLPCVFRLDSLLHPRGSNVRGLLGLAICRWNKSFEVSWKVVRIRRKWRTHSTCCPPQALLLPYIDPSSLPSPLLDIPRFRHFKIWKQKMQCSDTTSSKVL